MAPRRGTPHILAVARGDEPADILLAGGLVFSTGTREWLREDLAICDGVAQVRLGGVCAGCPGTIMSVLMGLEQELRRQVPEIDYLEAVP